VLVAVAGGWLLGLGVRLVFPAVLPQIRAEFGFDLSTAGLLLSALWVGYAAMQFPGGALADRVGERLVLASSTALTCVGVAGVTLAPGAPAFFVATILVGVGVGLYGTTRLTVLGDVFPERSGTAIGINQAAGNVGTTVLPAVAGLLAVSAGWRYGFGLVLPGFLLVTVGLWRSVPRRTSEPDTGGLSPADRRYLLRVVRHPQVVLSTVVLATVSFVYQAFTGFFPTYLVAEKGVGPGPAATLLGVFFASGVVVQPVAGIVRDRVGTRASLAAVTVTAAAVLASLTAVQGDVAVVAVTVLASAQLAVWPITNSYVVDVVPDDVQGMAVGLTRTVYLLVGAAGPVFVGFAGDVGRFDGAFLALAALALLATLPSLRLVGGVEVGA